MVDDPNRLSDEELSALTSAESFADDLAGMAGQQKIQMRI